MRVTTSVLVLAAAVAVVAVGVGVTLAAVRWRVDQPIAFNHRLHVQDLGLACADCHRYVMTGARATIPNVEVCSDCHLEALTDSPEERILVDHVERGEPIPWRKVYRVPDHVLFSHRRHAAIAAIDCERCHGAMADREQPVTRPAVRQTMESCIECHEDQGVTRDCIACHV
ncbi:MAG: cytochrome c3 family protein [Acidobacteriota bacterium]